MRFVSRSTIGIFITTPSDATRSRADRCLAGAGRFVWLAFVAAILSGTIYAAEQGKDSGIIRYVAPPNGEDLQLNPAAGTDSKDENNQSAGESQGGEQSQASPNMKKSPTTNDRKKKGPARAHLSSDPTPASNDKVMRISDLPTNTGPAGGSKPVSFDAPVRMQLTDGKENQNFAAAAAQRIRDRILETGSRSVTNFDPPPIHRSVSDSARSALAGAKPAAADRNKAIFGADSAVEFSHLVAPKPSAIVYAQPPRNVESLEQIKGQKTAGVVDELDEGFKPITSIGADIRPEVGELPTDFAATRFARVGQMRQTMGSERGWANTSKDWEAPGLCHRPLYFEEPNLERYGYSAGYLQPAISAAHFFSSVPMLPYKMTVDRPWSCNYTLGHYRPGSYAPFRPHRTPLRLDAASVQGWVMTGLIFWIP